MTEPSDDLGPTDRELLRRAELALTQLNNRHGLEPDQSATLTAIRLRLEGKSRASLDDLLTAGKDLGGKDPLTEAMTTRQLMMTTATKELYAFLDTVEIDNDGLIFDRYRATHRETPISTRITRRARSASTSTRW